MNVSKLKGLLFKQTAQLVFISYKYKATLSDSPHAFVWNNCNFPDEGVPPGPPRDPGHQRLPLRADGRSLIIIIIIIIVIISMIMIMSMSIIITMFYY